MQLRLASLQASLQAPTGTEFFDPWGNLRITVLQRAMQLGMDLSQVRTQYNESLLDVVLREPVDAVSIGVVGIDGQEEPCEPFDEAESRWPEYLTVAQNLATQGVPKLRPISWHDVVYLISTSDMYFRFRLWPRLQIYSAAGMTHRLRLLVSPMGESLIHSFAPRVAMIEGWPSYRLKFLERLGCTTRAAIVEATPTLQVMIANAARGCSTDLSSDYAYWEAELEEDGQIKFNMKRQGADNECIENPIERMARAQEWYQGECRRADFLLMLLQRAQLLPYVHLQRVESFLFGSRTMLDIDHEPESSDSGESTLGQELAAEVIEEVDHDETPADIPAEEAAQIADQQWATRVEELLARGEVGSDEVSRATGHTKRCVLLEFSRHPQELEGALLNSSVADAACQQGIEVQPAWANGAKIFVKEFGPDQLDEPLANGQLKPCHVIVYESDKADLQVALQSLPYRVKKLKPGVGRSIVPQELSLLEVSSEGEHEFINDAAGPMIEYVIKNTFVEIGKPQPVLRSTRSV